MFMALGRPGAAYFFVPAVRHTPVANREARGGVYADSAVEALISASEPQDLAAKAQSDGNECAQRLVLAVVHVVVRHGGACNDPNCA
jgi:hypothetical protein